jgi:fatty acid desaturase
MTHIAVPAPVLTDPVYRARPLNVLERAATAIVRDPRDLPFVWLIVSISVTVLPWAIVLICDPAFGWPLAVGYLLLVVGFFLLPFLVMYHDVAHRPFVRARYAPVMSYLNWVLGPLFGLFPNCFRAHHVVMHHVENNLARDLSSTLTYRRDSLADFLRYAGNFLFTVFWKLSRYLWQRRRYRLFRAVVIGELSYLVVIAGVAWFNWRAALVVFVIPLAAAMAGFICTNWSEHAFVDRSAPENVYRNTITCINTLYNHLVFNNGYHLTHHLKPALHWTEMPGELDAERGTYAREGAIIFAGLDYYRIWFLLMTKQYGVLARHCVHLGGRARSQEEIAKILRERTAVVDT